MRSRIKSGMTMADSGQARMTIFRIVQIFFAMRLNKKIGNLLSPLLPIAFLDT